jgi:hypothetical protein
MLIKTNCLLVFLQRGEHDASQNFVQVGSGRKESIRQAGHFWASVRYSLPWYTISAVPIGTSVCEQAHFCH